jgi:multimeric flavodoxin WrbA
MKLLAIVGSMRKDKYTNMLVNSLINDIKEIEKNIESEIIYICDKEITNCRVTCSNYCISRNYECSIKDDVADILEKMISTDALIIGAPLYFRTPPAIFHTFAERLVALFFNKECQGSNAEESPLFGKPTALIGMAEYSNPSQILEYLNDFCNILKMNAVKIGKFPYIGVGGQGDVTGDKIFNPLESSKEMAVALVNSVRETK